MGVDISFTIIYTKIISLYLDFKKKFIYNIINTI